MVRGTSRMKNILLQNAVFMQVARGKAAAIRQQRRVNLVKKFLLYFRDELDIMKTT